MNRLLLLLTATLATPSHALNLAGTSFPDTLPANTDRPALQLNQARVKPVYGLSNAYVGLVYNAAPSAFNVAYADKRIAFHILTDRVSGYRIATALYEALQLNLDEYEFGRIDQRAQQFMKILDQRLVKGDSGYIEYRPGEGSRIVINDEIRGIIPGKDLFDAIAGSWIAQPEGELSLRQSLLSLNEQNVQYRSAPLALKR